jgi:hypothetical protein
MKTPVIDPRVKDFVSLLVSYEGAPDVFNPWVQVDPLHDLTDDAPSIRRRNLEIFLTSRLNSARVILIAEALGYQGGHFTGLAMTSERMLLGKHRCVKPADILPSGPYERTSREDLKRWGYTEPTATVVWGAVLDCGISTYDVVTWNAFPWHPHPEGEYLANRTPRATEFKRNVEVMSALFSLFPNAEKVAVGIPALEGLTQMGFVPFPAAHPSHGGANIFRQQLRELFQE